MTDECPDEIWSACGRYCEGLVERDGLCCLHARAKEKRERRALEQAVKEMGECIKILSEARHQASKQAPLDVDLNPQPTGITTDQPWIRHTNEGSEFK